MILPEQFVNGTETGEQTALFAWAAIAAKDYPQLKWLVHIPNENQHKKIAQGVRAGVPDVMLPVVRYNENDSPQGGLFIEMKREIYRNRKNGGRSDDQVLWAEYLQSAGYQYALCYNWMEARDALLKYLGVDNAPTSSHGQ